MIRDIISDKTSLFGQGAHTELRAQENTAVSVVINNGNTVTNQREVISGVSARVLKNGVCGFASDAEYSESAVARVLRAADENASFLDRRINKRKPLPSVSERGEFSDRVDFSLAEQKRYVDFSRELDSYISDKYPQLASRRVVVKCDSMEKLLITSDAYNAHTTLPRSYVYLLFEVQTKDKGPVNLMKVLGGFGGFDDNFTTPDRLYEEIEALYESVMQKREGVYAEAGLKTCILGGALTGMLAHEAVGHTVEADLVLGGSVAAHNLGRRVASELVNLTDFAHTAYGERTPLPVYVDDEGVLCQDTKIIENGILTGYMNNLESAEHFNMRATGNARAFSYSDEPLIRMRNTAVLAGDSKLEEMIESVKDGYYLTDTNNGQADTSGEFMFGVCMGYEIKNGRLGRPILDTTISGVAFDMLKTVDMVGDKMEWLSSGMCGKKQPMPVGLGGPAIRCKVTMGGK